MTASPTSRLTAEAYLALDRAAEGRSEFFDGEMFAMAGGTWNHGVVAANFTGALNRRFDGRPSQAVSENVRVKIDATGRYTYPDVAALCGAPQFEDSVGDTLLNPALIVEVLSDSTSQDDRGTKFLRYQLIASLTEYVLVSQHEPVIIRYNRQASALFMASTASSNSSLSPSKSRSPKFTAMSSSRPRQRGLRLRRGENPFPPLIDTFASP